MTSVSQHICPIHQMCHPPIAYVYQHMCCHAMHVFRVLKKADTQLPDRTCAYLSKYAVATSSETPRYLQHV